MFKPNAKKTKNLEKRLDVIPTRINSLEKNKNELIELKNTTQELHKHTQVSIAKSMKQKKIYQRLKINSMK